MQRQYNIMETISKEFMSINQTAMNIGLTLGGQHSLL